LAPASDGQTVASGDTVRTGADGRAVIEYFDGSVTRLDHDTTFAVSDMSIRDDEEHSSLIDTAQVSGDSYHRIADLTESESRFDVVTPTATASVQGTVFAVIFEEDGSVIFAVFEGTVIVETPDGPITVLTGFMVIVHPGGTIRSGAGPGPSSTRNGSSSISVSSTGRGMRPRRAGPHLPVPPEHDRGRRFAGLRRRGLCRRWHLLGDVTSVQ
jgi:ferric-dicitrate binding protein FerR (iron transport regulator)